MLEGDPLSQFH